MRELFFPDVKPGSVSIKPVLGLHLAAPLLLLPLELSTSLVSLKHKHTVEETHTHTLHRQLALP